MEIFWVPSNEKICELSTLLTVNLFVQLSTSQQRIWRGVQVSTHRIISYSHGWRNISRIVVNFYVTNSLISETENVCGENKLRNERRCVRQFTQAIWCSILSGNKVLLSCKYNVFSHFVLNGGLERGLSSLLLFVKGRRKKNHFVVSRWCFVAKKLPLSHKLWNEGFHREKLGKRFLKASGIRKKTTCLVLRIEQLLLVHIEMMNSNSEINSKIPPLGNSPSLIIVDESFEALKAFWTSS